jgi:choline dehydrogenase-like flavoprotein
MLESGTCLPKGLLLRAFGRSVVRRFPSVPSDRNFVASGDPEVVWTNALAPGGLTNFWTGAVPRFSVEDFVEGEQLHPQYRWPVSYDQLESFYTQVERLCSVTGDPRGVQCLPTSTVSYERYLPDDWGRLAAIADSRGHGMKPSPIAEGSRWMVLRRATAFNSYANIVRGLIGSPNFQMVSGAHVLRIECSRTSPRATGVVYFNRHTHREEYVKAEAVVAAAGALATTKILLNSISPRFPFGLGNTEGVLGKYLHDHPKDWFEVELGRPLRRVGFPIYFSRLAYANSPPLLAAQGTLVNARSVREKILTAFPTKSHWLGVLVMGTVIPSERGCVRLDAVRKDEFGLPALDIHTCYDEDTKRNTERACGRLMEILDEAGLQPRLQVSLDELSPPGESVHFGGTVRMHESPKYGMVDQWNRLHAVKNVLVTDASCFTTGVEKNPALTIMALSLRASDKLASDLKSGVVADLAAA